MTPAPAEPPFTYDEVGATARRPLPSGYHHLERSRVVGTGQARFEEVAEGVMTWEVPRRAGLKVTAAEPRAQVGSTVVVRLGPGPLGVNAPCRVVHVIDEPRHKGFAYGTLEGHPERGEESFSVEWRDDDSVVLHIVAFSRPATWWSRAGAPFARIVQILVTQRYLRAFDGN